MLGLASIWMGRAAGQTAATREDDLKATFLYSFAKFVDWPPAAEGAMTSFRIEIIGRDPFDGRFDQLMIGKQIKDHPIEVVHSLAAPSKTPVHVAFVSTSEDKRLESLLASYRQNGVLTVSDIVDFTARGGMIGFVTTPGAVRFKINRMAAEQAQLKVSARLLALGL